jgi:HK97 family phage portal protein
MNPLARFGLWLVSKSAGPGWFADFVEGGGRSSADIPVNAESAQRSAAVFACVQVRAQDVAKLPLTLYRRQRDGGRMRDTEHAAFRATQNPNARQTGFEWREMKQAHCDLRGNAYSRIYRDSRMDIADIVPLHPDWVRPLHGKDGAVFYDVRMWGGSKTERLGVEDILHVKDRSDDGFIGKSCIARAKDAIGLDIAATTHASKLFANGARPGGLLIHKSYLSAAARDLVADEFTKKFGGSDNAHRVAVLGEDMKYQAVGMDQDEAQFIESRKLSRAEIASIFRVPAHKVGILDNATFSNIEHQSLEYVTDTLLPIARRWEMALNKSLLKESERAEYYFEFNFDALLRGDTLSRFQSYAIGRQWGIWSINDIMDFENRNHVEGGDERLVPLNMWPLGEPRPETALTGQPPGKAYDDYADIRRLFAVK